MANRRGNPNIKEYGKKTRFNAVNGCSAVEAGKKSQEAQAAFKPLRELLKEQCTEEDRRQINDNLIRMAKRNIRAYEMLMRALGEDPGQKIEVSGSLNIADMLREAQERENMVIDDAEVVDGDAE